MTVAPADDPLNETAWEYILEAVQDKLDNEIGFSQPTNVKVLQEVERVLEGLKKVRKNYFVQNLLKGM